MASLIACLIKCIKESYDYICKHDKIFLGIFGGLYALFIFLLSLPLIPLGITFTIEPTLITIKFFFIMFLISYLAAKCIVERGIISKEPRSLSNVGITFIISSVVTVFIILIIKAIAILKHDTIVPQDLLNVLLQISLNFLIGGAGLIGVALPILLSSMRGECCCKSERPSQHTECNKSNKKESEGEKGGSLS